MQNFGKIAFLGSGETAAAGGQIFEAIASEMEAPVSIRILETPAGFELNAERVAGRVADFLSTRLQNVRPEIKLIAARKRGTPASPDSPTVLSDLLNAQIVFMGPGSPTYAVRQLRDSLAWQYVQALHRQGSAIVLASAATIAMGKFALPVYEIYKAGEDPYWVKGLDFFEPYGLSLVFIPHWNNSDGGTELDTSHCFMGLARYQPLAAQLSPEITVVGLDEHTGIIIDFGQECCHVMGRSAVHLIREQRETVYSSGEQFPLQDLGPYHPLADPHSGIDAVIWQTLAEARHRDITELERARQVPQQVIDLVQQREAARAHRQWAESDRLRDEIAALGWKVKDTPQGTQLERS